jgi:hypothetical protein
MTYQPPCFAVTLLFLLLALPGLVAAAENPPHTPTDFDFKLELKASDLDAITMEVLKQHPLLSASPGIKAAYGDRQYPSGESAQVVFYPHAESRGVKQAFQVFCHRDDTVSAWSCPVVQIRRYVKLDSQDFEVRVKGDIDTNGVLAITEATRPLAASAVPDTSAADTVLVVFPANGGYVVSWGSKTGFGAVTVEARLRSAGNPSNPSDWEALVLPENE